MILNPQFLAIEKDLSYVQRLVYQGGPHEAEYKQFTLWLTKVHELFCRGMLSSSQLSAIRSTFARALSSETMQGLAFTKPRGYAGDFELIDRIYQCHITHDDKLAAWDHCFHHNPAAKAVRNRKTYFCQLLDKLTAGKQSVRVLNIASGPGRAMFEWLSANSNADIQFDCIEIDANAIRYAASLNSCFLDRINFVRKNALRFQPEAKYDLIWASGIFDYFSDRIFVRLLNYLFAGLAPGGELVVGNFSADNPSRPAMEILMDWNLHHRTPDKLKTLAMNAGATQGVTVGKEPEGINLFLHVRRTP